MTQATAATVAAALINAGYIATISKNTISGVYKVQATDPAGAPVLASAVASFATSNSVTGQLYMAEFI